MVYAQRMELSGKVFDMRSGEVLPGVNIVVDGTALGTVSRADGSYQLNVQPGDKLVFSSIGFQTQAITLENQTMLNIGLSADIRALDEVIVTGYTVESRKLITGALSTVEPKDLTISPMGNLEQTLQGRVSGVTVITNGQPGTTSQVRIHGYGALQGNEPLYVIDGVPTGSIDFMDPGDIESMTVLKDAPAASIYGSRAAGGVIVVETKQGSKIGQGMKITYDGMVGIIVPGKSPDLMNPEDQAKWTWQALRNSAIQTGGEVNFSDTLQNPFINIYGSDSSPELPEWLEVGAETGHNLGKVNLEQEAEKYDIDISDGQLYRVVPANQKGTNWYKAITHNALVHRHHLGLSGSGSGNQYHVGLAVQEQEGTMLYQKFQRYSLRVNSKFRLLPGLSIGENFQVTYRELRNIRGRDGGAGSADGSSFTAQDVGRINSDFTNDIQTAYETTPIIPVFDSFGGYGGEGAVPGVNGINPVARLARDRHNRNQNTALFGNVYLMLEPVKGLVARTSFGGQYRNYQGSVYYPTTYENQNNVQTYGYFQESSWQTQWVWTNTISYRFNTADSHSFKILLGQEALNDGYSQEINGRGTDPFSQSIDFINLSTVGNRSVGGNHSNGVNFLSYFGSFNYHFQDKYLISLVVRRDGSSRFGKNERWGTFPAISIGWRISQEPFFQTNFIDDLRVRLGYGEMGNSNNVHPHNQFDRFTTSLDLSSYSIQGANGQVKQGFYRNLIGNPNGSWETSVTKNLGLDVLLANIDFTIDLWQEDTNDLLYQYPITVQTGLNAVRPFVNIGEMRNRGVDIQLRIKANLTPQIKFRAIINGSFLENEIISLGPGIDQLPEISNSYSALGSGIEPVLNQVGYPLSSFYGYKVSGLFRDQDEVDQAPAQEGAAPGRFRYQDVNSEIPYTPAINPEDRTYLGNPIPDFTGGFSATFSYKNFDLQLYGYAVVGNEIYNLKRRTTDFFNTTGGAINNNIKNSWTFDNPNSNIPLFENAQNFSTNTQSSSYYIEDGSYFRMQNITLAYNFGPSLIGRWGFDHFRISASANNLFTITNYSGLDPGVGGNLDYNFGIDGGNYPVNTSWMLGVNVSF